MYSMTPKFFLFFFGIRVIKIRKILRWFQICGNNWKKVHPEKVLCQTLLQVNSIEEENLWFFTFVLAVTFLLANFSHFSQQFRNQRKILCCFDTHIQILQRKSFYVILALFETIKPDSQETAQNFEKRVLQKCLRITFYTCKPVNPFQFLKKHQNRCTLPYISYDALLCSYAMYVYFSYLYCSNGIEFEAYFVFSHTR